MTNPNETLTRNSNDPFDEMERIIKDINRLTKLIQEIDKKTFLRRYDEQNFENRSFNC